MVILTVKPAYAYTLTFRFPSGISLPLRSSVTFLEETAPVKLTTKHCLLLAKDEVRKKKREVFHWRPKAPSYAQQFLSSPQCLASVKLSGSFCPGADRPHLHSHFNFVEQRFKTVIKSLYLSCGPELTRQGVTLP